MKKTIIIYSGKGGVGKSTITAWLAKAIAKELKVCVIDGDLTGPSMHLLLNEKSKNLTVFSIGYKNQNGLIEFQEAAAIKIFKNYKNNIPKDTDIILIDTPPGITGIHNAIIKSIGIDGVLVVSQPDELSLNKVARTADFFRLKGIETIGMVLNMVKNKEKTIENEIMRIPYKPDLETPDLSPLIQLVKDVHGGAKPMLFNRKDRFQTINEEDINNMLGATRGLAAGQKNVLRFYNLETWDYVSEKIKDLPVLKQDLFLMYNSTKVIKRMLDIFKDSDTELVKIIRPPMTEVALFGAEVGIGTLITDAESHYGVPRIRYWTDEAEIILFPHEVADISADDFELMIKNKEIIRHPTSNTERYIPTPELFRILLGTFGIEVAGNPKAYNKIFKIKK